MNTIIALQGKGNSGKTTTIRNLYSLLLKTGYHLEYSNYRANGKDFLAIFLKNDKLVGITSEGDTFDKVYTNLRKLVEEDCSICICACRTRDLSLRRSTAAIANRSQSGTLAAIDAFTEYTPRFIAKTIDKNVHSMDETNDRDTQILLNEIESLL